MLAETRWAQLRPRRLLPGREEGWRWLDKRGSQEAFLATPATVPVREAWRAGRVLMDEGRRDRADPPSGDEVCRIRLRVLSC